MVGGFRRQLGVALMFATNGISVSSVLPWYPTFKQQWEMSDFAFGFMVTALAFGSLLAAALPAWAERTFGARACMLVGTALTALLLVAIGFAPGAWFLAALLLTFGLIDTVIDVSQNVAAVRVEHEAKRSIMSSLHACWSLGAVLGGIGGTYAASSGINVAVHLIIVAIVQVVLVALSAFLMGDVNTDTTMSPAEDGSAGQEKSSKLTWRVIWIALPAAIVATSGTIVEDIGNNWAPLSAVELAGVSVGAAGAAYIAMYATQMVGRFLGDLLITRFGRVPVARAGGLAIAVGGIAVVMAQSPTPLYLGYALVGWGCATLVPSAYAASAELPGITQSTGMTVVSWLMRAGFMATSPLLGMVSEATSLRFALVLLPVIGVAALVASSGLKTRVVKQM